MMHMRSSLSNLAILCTGLALTSCAQESEADPAELARGIHERIITLDTYTAAVIRP